MPAENETTAPHYFVQNRRTVIHATGTFGAGMRRTTFGPGQQIPAGLLAPDEVARLLANGTIGHRPPVPYTPAPAPSPSGVGYQNPAILSLNAQGPLYNGT